VPGPIADAVVDEFRVRYYRWALGDARRELGEAWPLLRDVKSALVIRTLNGGFAQYLDNKGRRRAGAALAALHAVGARRTARMLEQALAPRTSATRMSTLDDRFYAVPEDLALLTGRHVGLRAEKR
jgi:hypothetical protein